MIIVGTVVNNTYRMLHRLGSGGFGEVWLAQDTVLGKRHVAIKFLTQDVLSHQALFLDEMHALSELKHPCVVSFFHHFEVDGKLALVMEYCEGGTLSHQTRESKNRTPEAWIDTVSAWVVSVAETLAAVHARGYVHQDIKPSNLLLKNGMPVVADFGIVNTAGGTPQYSSPDKRLGLSSANDPREDVYSLGVTLLELAMGRHPFGGLVGSDLERAKQRRSLQGDVAVPDWLMEIGLKAIHPDVALRFQSAQDFANALRERRLPAVIDREAMKAHRAVLAGERALKRAAWKSAERSAEAALQLCPGLPSAVLLAGRVKLVSHQTDAAFELLKTIQVNQSGHLIGMELGWLFLQRGELPQAIATFSDELARNPLNMEATCLLLECYWRVRRFDEMKRVAQIMVDEKCDSLAFENAGLLARLGGRELTYKWLEDASARGLASPFAAYNVSVARAGINEVGGFDALLDELLFQEYRFGLPSALKTKNAVVVEQSGRQQRLPNQIISIGKLPGNVIQIDDASVSRRHAVLTNVGNEVWIHDLASTRGIYVDGERVVGKRILLGVHDVLVGEVKLRVSASEDLVA